MRIKVETPAELPELIAMLSARIDAVVSLAGFDEVEVSLLGSRHPEADAAELERRLRALPVKARLLRDR